MFGMLNIKSQHALGKDLCVLLSDRLLILSHAWCITHFLGLFFRYNEQCSLLVLASAGGVVAWHLIAHTPRPEWTERDPNCVLSEDGKVVAVKNQVNKPAYAWDLLSDRLS